MSVRVRRIQEYVEGYVEPEEAVSCSLIDRVLDTNAGKPGKPIDRETT